MKFLRFPTKVGFFNRIKDLDKVLVGNTHRNERIDLRMLENSLRVSYIPWVFMTESNG